MRKLLARTIMVTALFLTLGLLFNVASVQALGFSWNVAKVTDWGFGWTTGITMVSETYKNSHSHASAYRDSDSTLDLDGDIIAGLGVTNASADVIEASGWAYTNPDENATYGSHGELRARAYANPVAPYYATAGSDAFHTGVIEFYGEGYVWLYAYYELTQAMITDMPGDLAHGDVEVRINYSEAGTEYVESIQDVADGGNINDTMSGLLSAQIFFSEEYVCGPVLIPYEIMVDAESSASSAPVPEPTTVLLFSFGLLGLAAFKMKFRKE